jgi:hypothetical protein
MSGHDPLADHSPGIIQQPDLVSIEETGYLAFPGGIDQRSAASVPSRPPASDARGQHFAGRQLPIRRAADRIGERAPDVDPELPLSRHLMSVEFLGD